MLIREDGQALELIGAGSVGKDDAPVRLVRRDGSWWAEGGVALIDGEPPMLSVALKEGSEIAAARHSWRLQTVPQRLNRHPQLEAAIRDDPDDEAAWSVYLDWLLEHGDVLVQPEEQHTAGTWLEVFERRHGFVLAARARGGFGPLPEDVESVVRTIAFHPRMRFLRRLEVQPLSWMRDGDVDDALQQVIRAFERVSIPSIQELIVGPFWEDALPDFTELSSADWQLPRLRVVPRKCVKTHARAWLESDDAARTIRDDSPFGVQRGAGGWLVPWAHVEVNGRRVRGATHLFDRDTVRSGNITAVFRAV